MKKKSVPEIAERVTYGYPVEMFTARHTPRKAAARETESTAGPDDEELRARCRAAGVDYRIVRQRMEFGWDEEAAMQMPTPRKKRMPMAEREKLEKELRGLCMELSDAELTELVLPLLPQKARRELQQRIQARNRERKKTGGLLCQKSAEIETETAERS